MTLREQLEKLRREFPQRHPIIKGMVLLALIVGPITCIAYIMNWGDVDLQRDTRDFLQTTTWKLLLIKMVIIAPFVEELMYRGPAFLLLLLCGLISRLMKKTGRNPFLETYLIKPLRVEDCVVWPAILIPTYFWAQMHPFPLPIFCTGVVLGWIMVKTRNILCNIIAHALLNAIVLLGVVLGLSILY